MVCWFVWFHIFQGTVAYYLCVDNQLSISGGYVGVYF